MTRAKLAAATAAADLVEDGMLLGFGSGSTVGLFLDELARQGRSVRGIPTSATTAEICTRHGFELIDPSQVARVDLAVDGADELDPALRLVKGGGGALLREKVVATMADRFVVIATIDKLVARLGDSFPVPVEVVPFALAPVRRALEAERLEVHARSGGAYLTDNGNAVLDCRIPGGIGDPAATDAMISSLPGVVCTGLFLGLADEALLGHEDSEVTRRVPDA